MVVKRKKERQKKNAHFAAFTIFRTKSLLAIANNTKLKHSKTLKGLLVREKNTFKNKTYQL